MMSSARPLAVPRPVSCRITSFDGEEIHYDLYEGTSRSAILIVPGFWRERRHPSMVRLATLFHGLGYRSAVCDLRGHGESGGTFGFNRNEHHDVAAVVVDLTRDPSVDSVTLIGFSYGGAIAISTAARHQLPITSLVLISPVADFGMLAPRINPFTIHRHIALRLAFHRPRFPWLISRAPKIRALDDVQNVHVPLCLIHVKNDWLVDHSHSVALYERANEPKELHVMEIEGNYHADRILSVAGNAIEPIMTEFVERYTPR